MATDAATDDDDDDDIDPADGDDDTCSSFVFFCFRTGQGPGGR